MQNLWFTINLLLLLTASSCLQKQKTTESHSSNQGAALDSAQLMPTDDMGKPLVSQADTIKPLPPKTPVGKTQNAPSTKKGTEAKGKEVHAPMPENTKPKDAERLEKERQKKKREGQ